MERRNLPTYFVVVVLLAVAATLFYKLSTISSSQVSPNNFVYYVGGPQAGVVGIRASVACSLFPNLQDCGNAPSDAFIFTSVPSNQRSVLGQVADVEITDNGVSCPAGEWGGCAGVHNNVFIYVPYKQSVTNPPASNLLQGTCDQGGCYYLQCLTDMVTCQQSYNMIQQNANMCPMGCHWRGGNWCDCGATSGGASAILTTTTTTIQSSTTTTASSTTTTQQTGFTATDFSCNSIDSKFRCRITYSSDKSYIVQFTYADQNGDIKGPTEAEAQAGSSLTAGSLFDCTAYSSGQYKVRWYAYNKDDTDLSSVLYSYLDFLTKSPKTIEC